MTFQADSKSRGSADALETGKAIDAALAKTKASKNINALLKNVFFIQFELSPKKDIPYSSTAIKNCSPDHLAPEGAFSPDLFPEPRVLRSVLAEVARDIASSSER